MDVSPELRDPASGVDNPYFCWEGVSRERSVDAGDVIDAAVASVTQGVDKQTIRGLVCGEEGGDSRFDVGAAFAFRVEEELHGVDCYEDYSGLGVQGHIGVGVVGGVFWDGVHPGAEEDGCWCKRGGL